ncbi:MAG: GH3 auxin-responsive promoter family protein [Chitinophagales bacterium]
MSVVSSFIQLVANYFIQKQYKIHNNGIEVQKKVLKKLIKQAQNTHFGKEHSFDTISNYEDYKAKVPLNSYENLKKYIEEIAKGKQQVLWNAKTIYFAKTSGTTSGTKYIPITKDSIKNHISAARNSLFAYVAETGNADFFTKKMIFLQGSPELEMYGKIKTGRLSGIVYHHVPFWLLRNRKPSYETNCIEDWEQKVDTIVNETYMENMSLLSGIPPWCMQYFEKLLAKTNKANLKQLFPSLQLYVYGGLNYEPYKEKMDKLLGENVDKIETYPASEGFFAYQDSQKEKGLLLNIDSGIFYEFIRVEDYLQGKMNRICLKDVDFNTQYVLVVSSNAGLWAYDTGDTVKFVSLKPYRIVVTGRVKHFISAFGEHVIQEEVEKAIEIMSKQFNASVVEFTVAPFVGTENKKSYHEWFIEFTDLDINTNKIASFLDESIQEQNIYYKDLRENGILKEAKISVVKNGGFEQYFKLKGKLGGQNKVQHLANNRELAKVLKHYVKNG